MSQNADPNRQIQLRIDESRMSTTYANTIRTSTMPDELVLDFGMNMPMPNPEGQTILLFSVGSRVVMNWPAAKRLAISLGQAVRQFEEQNGEIKLQQGGQGPGGPRLAQ
ncbi:MAG: DUF3467 domain-containing protein [Phycisphaerales bacterium]